MGSTPMKTGDLARSEHSLTDADYARGNSIRESLTFMVKPPADFASGFLVNSSRSGSP